MGGVIVDAPCQLTNSLQCTFGVLIKRLWFHPLSNYPGPPLWAASRNPYVASLLFGTLNEDISRLHERYGEVIRLAPNELSFSTKQAWKDIYMHRSGHKESKKDPVWYIGKIMYSASVCVFDRLIVVACSTKRYASKHRNHDRHQCPRRYASPPCSFIHREVI